MLQRLAIEIGGEIEVCDVSDREAVALMTARILERHPAVDLLVNSAGILARGSFVDASSELIEQALAVNYLGGVWTTRGLLDGLREAARLRGRAHIATIASIGGSIVFTPAAPYSASKHAQVAFSRSLRAALHGTGIEVHTILPGFVDDTRLPAPEAFRHLARPTIRRRAGAGCHQGRRRRREGQGRGHRPVVPVRPRAARPGDRADADGDGSLHGRVPRRARVTLPPTLLAGIDELTRNVGRKELEQSARALSDAYRTGGTTASRAVRTTAEVAAYLVTRAPATYAAAAEVFRQTCAARPSFAPSSLLDLGAGPGVAAWAAIEAWPGIATASLVEAEVEMVRAGRSLAAHGTGALRAAAWTVTDAGDVGSEADLVVASYVLGELGPGSLVSFIHNAWARTADTLVIVEPGTTAGYERVLAARAAVIGAGGTTLAPCPHDTPCPLP